MLCYAKRRSDYKSRKSSSDLRAVVALLHVNKAVVQGIRVLGTNDRGATLILKVGIQILL